MHNLITKVSINSLGNFNTTFPALLHSLLNKYSSGDKQGWRKTKNLPQWFIPYQNDKKSTNAWSFGAPFLPLLIIFSFQYDSI